ncbi:DUF2341 domain-containing protein [Chitinophaga sp. SYP-B3965]|uniref:DUF2341 domain-containing protein n=1 Tax=Chitinophaga sp. SYP-B3965 TaxID=2663120 RepID=UPI001299DC3B|nr:DUF2341 domain-containing protein [Chitinophaga sp. SYP-B3965]MRG45112.1 DUF2341 domain-containing protein [Chitinophaga sp. SYP-B3965]
MKHLLLSVLVYFTAQDLDSWQYYKEIRLNTSPNGANVTGDVKDFPLAITLTVKNFDFSQAKANGADIRFSNGRDFLPHSIEWWDPVHKKALVWVKVPLIKGNNATQTIYMHWGNTRANDEDHTKEIFSGRDGFVGVWHLSEPGNTLPEGYKDATDNAADATGVNMRPGALTDGIIGKAQFFNYPDKQWIKVDTEKRKLFDLTRQITFSIWAKARSYANVGDEAKRVGPGYETMFAKGDNSWRLQKFGPRYWHKPAAELIEICVEQQPKGDLCVVGKTDMVTGKWFHITGVHDFPYVKLYVNGVLDKVEKFDVEWKSDDHPVGIGNQSQFPDKGGRFWDGVLDEARVLNVAKNEHWIKLDYESQREGSALLMFGKTQKRH